MKKYFNKLFFILLCVFAFGFTLPENYTDINVKSIKNPEYDDYKNLSDKEKDNVDLVPNKYIYLNDPESVIINSSLVMGPKVGDSYASSYDMRNVDGKRLIPNIKDQGNLGLCWTFATNNMLESYFIKKNNTTYNFSENHLSYVSLFFKDVNAYGDGNSLFNVSKYYFYGYAPILESKFGSYNLNYVDSTFKNYNSYLNTDDTVLDIKNTSHHPSYVLSTLMDNYDGATVESLVNNFNNTIKSHLINHSTVSTALYWYDGFKSTEPTTGRALFRNNGKGNYYSYYQTGHAATIIGWDDNIGEFTYKNHTYKGAWLAMNSWGEGSNHYDYYYISYYDNTAILNMMTAKDIELKSWDNVYTANVNKTSDDKSNVASSLYSYEVDGNYEIYTFFVGKEREKIDSVKILYEDSSDGSVKSPTPIVNVVTSSTTQTSNSIYSISYGINSFTFNNLYTDDEFVKIKISGLKGDYYKVALFTKEESKVKNAYIVENKDSDFKNKISNVSNFTLVTKNINPNTNYNVYLYDEAGNNISSSFLISTNILNTNAASFKITQQRAVTTSKITISVNINGVVANKIYYFGIEGDGTLNNPYVINNESDLMKLSESKAYFVLNKDLDMEVATSVKQGIYYNNGNGWKSINFYGYLDGNNHKIMNLNSKYGGLFHKTDSATIKNLVIVNANINDSKYNENNNISSNEQDITLDANNGNIEIGVLTNRSSNSIYENISIRYANVDSNNPSSLLVGNVTSGIFNNIKVNGSVHSKKTSGGIIAHAYQYQLGSITVKNCFVDKSKIYNDVDSELNSNYLIGIYDYIGYEQNNLPVLNMQNNYVNTMNETGYYNSSDFMKNNSVNIYNTSYLPVDISTYNFDKILVKNNNLFISNDERLNVNSFINYDKLNWSFNTYNSLYLKNQKEEDIEKINPTFNNYVLNNNVLKNINEGTSFDNLCLDINNPNSLYTFNYYNKNGVNNNNSSYVGTGDVLNICNINECKNYILSVSGDVNGDGKISALDYVAIRNHIMEDVIITANHYLIAADYNKDDGISALDYVGIRNYIMGEEDDENEEN